MAEQRKIKLGNLEFNCRVAGQEGDDPVILLHGFPETSIMWTRLMTELASKGYYCIAPDMRGYSENASPKGVKNYKMNLLVQDILGIADVFNIAKFHLIGHDWGAIVGWTVTYLNPQRIISWTALSVPHSKAFGKAYKVDPEQKKKSRYVGLFLLPIIPELRIRHKDFKGFRRLWKRSSPEELEDYLSVFRRKRSLTGALNYYRANIGRGKGQPIGAIETPTLFIWGNRDLAISAFAANENHQYMKGDYSFLEIEGGHWLIQGNYEEVASAINDHLMAYKTK